MVRLRYEMRGVNKWWRVHLTRRRHQFQRRVHSKKSVEQTYINQKYLWTSEADKATDISLRIPQIPK